ncbi:glycosyltransferase [Wenyingzhuangia sp. 2_MG-2023]|uniref:CgeB family protein n=1 Tax=Wenyingzhuangia sp. 2_MG-2023 TaxID=3062639 RepID=UPI0026E1BA0A|nr:glycosyltransferase [Wenyingzhuangia sp. 2_MG-2023]MDO6739312.1 glycosyltransferase [Wenyingzhuangia sp. 2_MG-2023]
MKTILYFGDLSKASNSFYRLKTLERLGYKVKGIDPKEFIPKNKFSFLADKIHYRTGYVLLQNRMHQKVSKLIDTIDFDLIWVNSGEFFGAKVLQKLKTKGKKIVLYNNDDPTGGRDGNRFISLLKGIPYYDVCAVMRDINVNEYKQLGVKNVIRVYMSYDEIVHHPFEKTNDIDAKFKSDIVFVGTWMKNEHRDEFLLKLIEGGLNISIWGGRWEKSPNWNIISKYHKGKHLEGRDYVAAIQGAKICLGMLSKGNRDLYTSRSVEIPYIGAVFCAERTVTHEKMYIDKEEAVFWSNPEECIKICKELLDNKELLESIKEKGREKVKKLKVGNEDVCREILMAIDN